MFFNLCGGDDDASPLARTPYETYTTVTPKTSWWLKTYSTTTTTQKYTLNPTTFGTTAYTTYQPPTTLTGSDRYGLIAYNQFYDTDYTVSDTGGELAISPSNNLLLCRQDDGTLLNIELTGSNAVFHTIDNSVDGDINYSQDGNHALYKKGGDLVGFDLNQSSSTVFASAIESYRTYPDNEYIYYIVTAGTTYDLYNVHPTNLTNTIMATNIYEYEISTDGTSYIFTDNKYIIDNTYVYDLKLYSGITGTFMDVDINVKKMGKWSSDGTLFSYISGTVSNLIISSNDVSTTSIVDIHCYDIDVAYPDSLFYITGPSKPINDNCYLKRILMSNPAVNDDIEYPVGYISVSPDGKYVASISYVQGLLSIIDVENQSVKYSIGNIKSDPFPQWSSDSKLIMFYSFSGSVTANSKGTLMMYNVEYNVLRLIDTDVYDAVLENGDEVNYIYFSR